ncbi:MAG: hypothetical protein Q8R25_01925 [bacterium]|nr:hypothetical protein [bacterium]
MTTKVAIIKAGEWVKFSKARDDYDNFVYYLTEALDEAEQTRRDGSKGKAAEIRTVENVIEARSYLKGKGIAIILTCGMQHAAEALAKENPKIRVLVFGLLPTEGKVIYVPKGWVTSKNHIKKLVLDLLS